MVDRKLGRGLDYFLSGARTKPAPDVTISRPEEMVTSLEISRLSPNPRQPRRAFPEAELAQLADSVRLSGILQPILVRKVGESFEIIAGERRWRAAQMAGLERVPVVLRSVTEEESAIFAIVENLQREDLNAMEKANAFKQLVTQFQASHEDIAKRVGLDRSTVANFMRLLDLPTAVQEHVSRGTLSMGHARSLLALSDGELQVQLADDAIRLGQSVRALEERIRMVLEASKGEPQSSPAASSRKEPVWVKELEENLAESIGASVRIRYGAKRSKIIIECFGREEFERVYDRLKTKQ
ncbi:chromosome partitioning protein ParB [Planctomycetota bacterium]|nr:ParB/RepB/Spo0J family partition protein [Planctomycetota bacterium]GDY01806.1 chromosome partitioning protein ParB [Planctomycetota bacterium]